MKLLSVDDAYLFFFHMVDWSFILGQGWLLSNHFCKAFQSFVMVCGCINFCFVVKAPANVINANLD